MSDITHILFDLGGVIVELSGRPIADEWLAPGTTPEESWNLWLTSDAPRAFESGRIDAETFAQRVVDELQLSVAPEAFMKRFLGLPVGPFDGALDLLHALKSRYRTGIFSNSNALHWPRKMGGMKLDTAVHDHFASHLIGHVKPDPAGFEHVLGVWQVDPSAILFLDDNRLNVEAAMQAGIQAVAVQGLEELTRVLRASGIRW